MEKRRDLKSDAACIHYNLYVMRLFVRLRAEKVYTERENKKNTLENNLLFQKHKLQNRSSL